MGHLVCFPQHCAVTIWVEMKVSPKNYVCVFLLESGQISQRTRKQIPRSFLETNDAPITFPHSVVVFLFFCLTWFLRTSESENSCPLPQKCSVKNGTHAHGKICEAERRPEMTEEFLLPPCNGGVERVSCTTKRDETRSVTHIPRVKRKTICELTMSFLACQVSLTTSTSGGRTGNRWSKYASIRYGTTVPSRITKMSMGKPVTGWKCDWTPHKMIILPFLCTKKFCRGIVEELANLVCEYFLREKIKDDKKMLFKVHCSVLQQIAFSQPSFRSVWFASIKDLSTQSTKQKCRRNVVFFQKNYFFVSSVGVLFKFRIQVRFLSFGIKDQIPRDNTHEVDVCVIFVHRQCGLPQCDHIQRQHQISGHLHEHTQSTDTPKNQSNISAVLSTSYSMY